MQEGMSTNLMLAKWVQSGWPLCQEMQDWNLRLPPQITSSSLRTEREWRSLPWEEKSFRKAKISRLQGLENETMKRVKFQATRSRQDRDGTSISWIRFKTPSSTYDKACCRGVRCPNIFSIFLGEFALHISTCPTLPVAGHKARIRLCFPPWVWVFDPTHPIWGASPKKCSVSGGAKVRTSLLRFHQLLQDVVSLVINVVLYDAAWNNFYWG